MAPALYQNLRLRPADKYHRDLEADNFTHVPEHPLDDAAGVRFKAWREARACGPSVGLGRSGRGAMLLCSTVRLDEERGRL